MKMLKLGNQKMWMVVRYCVEVGGEDSGNDGGEYSGNDGCVDGGMDCVVDGDGKVE